MGIQKVIDLVGPGSYGLNTQDESIEGSSLFASEATNCVIDDKGMLASRKGFKHISTPEVSFPVERIYTHYKNNGLYDLICAVNGKLITNIVPTHTTIATGKSTNKWAFASIKGYLFAAARGETMLAWNDSYVAQTITLATTPSLSQPNAITEGYGRLWVADALGNDYTVWWSDIADPRDFLTGDSGSIDLRSVFVNGKDSIVNIAVFNNRLIIFCKRSIYAYALPADTLNPADMQLVETIENVGCRARDSVQVAGNDIFFLSDSGLQSLGRLFDSNFTFPINNISRLIQQKFLDSFDNDNDDDIVSTYYPKEGYYVIISRVTNQAFVFNVLQPVPELGIPRVTVWQPASDSNEKLYSTCVYGDGRLLFGTEDGIHSYEGYNDHGIQYRMTFTTQWLGFGNIYTLKHLKRVRFVANGGSNQFSFLRWARDFVDTDFSTEGFNLDSGEVASEYGIAEYNIGEYTTGSVYSDVTINIGNSIEVVKFSLQLTVNDEKFTLQTMKIYATQGKTV